MNKPGILIIDDDFTMRNVIERSLSNEGYNLFFAENGEAGLSLFKKVSPVLILLDLCMPIMDGFTFLEEIQAKTSDPFFVIVLTSNSDNETIKRAYKLGVNGFIKKPFDFIELRCMVKRSVDLKYLELQQREAFHLDKMAALGLMAAGVSHELNNVLNIVNGDMHLIKADVQALFEYVDKFSKIPLAADVYGHIKELREKNDIDYIVENMGKKFSRCENALQRADVIVKNMKVFSSFEKEEIFVIDINKSIEGSLELIPNDVKQNVKITMECKPLPEIPCYGKQIHQVFLNIIKNACQAMKDGGDLKISTFVEDNFIYIKFCDNGTGIPEDKIKQVFDPFFTTKKIGEGTGLGLSISQSIINNQGGSIVVTNNKDKGVTFTIKLPKEGVKNVG